MSKFGIDISLHQKNIDLKKAKTEGVQFVIIKSSENNFADPQVANHVASAKAAGLPFGFYHWLSSTTIAGVKKEAALSIATVAKFKPFDYPVFVDVEDAKIAVLGKDKVTKLVQSFCDAVEKAGYWAGFYTNLDWYRNKLNGPALAARYSFWLATWAKTMPALDNIQMWQFGGSTNLIRNNKIAGVVCDQDYCYTDYPTLIKQRGLNGYTKSASSSASAKTEAAKTTTIKVGDRVKLKADAVVYGKRVKFQAWVYNAELFVREINTSNGRAVISTVRTGPVTGAVDVKFLVKL